MRTCASGSTLVVGAYSWTCRRRCQMPRWAQSTVAIRRAERSLHHRRVEASEASQLSAALLEGTSGTRWSTGLRRSVAASAAWGAPEGAPAPASPSRRSTEGTAQGAKSVPRSTVAQNLFRKGKESSYETVSPRTRARRAQAVNPERGSEDAPGRVVQTAGGGCHAIVPVLVRALELHRRLVQTR